MGREKRKFFLVTSGGSLGKGKLFDGGVENVKDREGRDKEVRIRDKSVGINGLDEFRCHLHGHLDVINSSIGINFRPPGNKYILLTIQLFLPSNSKSRLGLLNFILDARTNLFQSFFPSLSKFSRVHDTCTRNRLNR